MNNKQLQKDVEILIQKAKKIDKRLEKIMQEKFIIYKEINEIYKKIEV